MTNGFFMTCFHCCQIWRNSVKNTVLLIALQLNIIVINTVVCFATESVQNGKRVQLFNKNNNQEKWLAPRPVSYTHLSSRIKRKEI